jgi:NADH dehydrogenase/NADH:ubiquinone oxidoreductase subunit G
MKKLSPFILFTILFTPFAVISQTQEEVKAEVPELKAFHAVIYKLWHTAWPEQNISMMAQLVPDIEKGVEKIQKAQLPGILREKKSSWEEGLKELNEVVKEYKKAIASKDTQKILDAGEELHSQFESLVRITRPALKQLDEFHKVLYPLYHYYMPEYKRDKIKESAVEISAKMDSLSNADLPENLRAIGKDFHRRVQELSVAVKYFIKVAKEIDDEETVTNAIKDVHTKYQLLEQVLE